MTNQVDIFKKYGLDEGGFAKVEPPMHKHSSIVLDNEEEVFDSPYFLNISTWFVIHNRLTL